MKKKLKMLFISFIGMRKTILNYIFNFIGNWFRWFVTERV